MTHKVVIHTLGCKVNQYDAAALHQALEREGFTLVGDDQSADAIVVNTCTVTASTDRQNRQLIRRLRATHPGALLVVTGCQAEVFPETLERMDEVDVVVGNRRKSGLPEIILDALEGRNHPWTDPPVLAPLWEGGAERLPGRTRAFVKVQDGCGAFCTYCIVPLARGPSRSRPPDSVLQEIGRMEAAGIREMVLTGIHLGAYGRDLQPGTSLADLLDRILEACAIPRIRLSSIEPLEVDAELLERMRTSGRICPHLHLPLQSGDDEVLRWMKRPYNTSQYGERALLATEAVPDLTLGCDVIVGFPGETEAHFRRTLRFLDGIPFSYLHVFPFSPRPGTPAFHLPHRVDVSTMKARAQTLRDLSEERRAATMAFYLGRTLPVLVERPARGREGWMEGLTHNYLRVNVPGDDGLRNRILSVRMEAVEGVHIEGAVMPL